MLSYGLIVFTVGRFVATALAVIFESNFLLVVYSSIAIAMTSYVAAGSGTPGVAVLICIFFFMAPMYVRSKYGRERDDLETFTYTLFLEKSKSNANLFFIRYPTIFTM